MTVQQGARNGKWNVLEKVRKAKIAMQDRAYWPKQKFWSLVQRTCLESYLNQIHIIVIETPDVSKHEKLKGFCGGRHSQTCKKGLRNNRKKTWETCLHCTSFRELDFLPYMVLFRWTACNLMSFRTNAFRESEQTVKYHWKNFMTTLESYWKCSLEDN